MELSKARERERPKDQKSYAEALNVLFIESKFSTCEHEVIVPIHTEARDWFAKSFENVVQVEEGKQYKL